MPSFNDYMEDVTGLTPSSISSKLSTSDIPLSKLRVKMFKPFNFKMFILFLIVSKVSLAVNFNLSKLFTRTLSCSMLKLLISSPEILLSLKISVILVFNSSTVLKFLIYQAD
jgi:hypothetical protein